MGFKTQAEIYQALLDGKSVHYIDSPNYIYKLVDGNLLCNGEFSSANFCYAEKWQLVPEKQEVVYTEYLQINKITQVASLVLMTKDEVGLDKNYQYKPTGRTFTVDLSSEG